MIGQRRGLLAYLKEIDIERYRCLLYTSEAGAMTEITIEQAAEVMTEIVSEKKQLQLQLLMM